MSHSLEALKKALAGRYDIERELGAGGMATVYLANDIRHQRQVAVKVLKPDLANALGPDRFLREIRIAANLNHPHILALFDSGEADGFLYYVMPYISGNTLRDRIDKEGELPVREAVRVIREVADALAFAHSQGVVHRDIKPDNVMLAGNHAIVADFGVAKAVSEATGRDKLTTAGVALGTPAYMAPEQATADPHVDHRADIYALGALAYELLSGRTPFLGHTPQAVLAAHVTEQPDPVRKHRDQVSMEVDAVVMKCLAKKPADRWQTADEMLPHLETLGTPSGGLTPTDTRPYQAATGAATPISGMRRVLLGAVAAVVIVAAGFGAWTLRGGGGAGGSIDQIAVLPIMDLSGEDEVFVGAMHDALISAIALTNTVGVVSRSAVLQVDGGTTADIAKSLGVQAVMEGSVFRAGDEMRINVQLVEPNTLRHIWTGTYERNVSDVLAAQDEVVQTVASEMTTALSSDDSNAGS
jgi:serine/threonine-protein kinase